MPWCIGKVSSCEMNVARTDTQAAAWNNPSWLSNKKDSQTPRMKSRQVAKRLPTGKKTPPVLCWRRMRRRVSFLPRKRLIKNRAKHREEEKMVQPPADTTGMSRPYSTFFLNLTSRQWPSHDVSLPVVSFLLYGFGTRGNEAGNPNIKRAPTLTGTTVLQTFVRTTQWKPFPAESYKDGTLLQLSRNKVSRDSYSPEALQYYSPKQYKIKRDVLKRECSL